ncbi:hypothetical protein [Methanolobus sp. WCC5]|uniref:hypothetical protein n=1 Tax=Methanolobus sp. WCC5 TaxID=3125785 RepID=UPI003249B33E
MSVTRTASGIRYDTKVRSSKSSSSFPKATKSTGSGSAKLAAFKDQSAINATKGPAAPRVVHPGVSAPSMQLAPRPPASLAPSSLKSSPLLAQLNAPKPSMSPRQQQALVSYLTVRSQPKSVYDSYRTKQIADAANKRAEALRASAANKIDKQNAPPALKSFMKGVIADTPANTIMMFGNSAFGAEAAIRNPRLAPAALKYGLIETGKAIKATGKEDPARLAGQIIGAVVAGKAVGRVAGKTTKGTKAPAKAKSSKVTKPLSKQQRLAANVAKKNNIQLKAKARSVQRKITTAKKSATSAAKKQARINTLRKELNTIKKGIAKNEAIISGKRAIRKAGKTTTQAKTAVRRSSPAKKGRSLSRKATKATQAAKRGVRRSTVGKTTRRTARAAGKAKRTGKAAIKGTARTMSRAIAREYNKVKLSLARAFRRKPTGISKQRLEALQRELNTASNQFRRKRITALEFRQAIRKINKDFEAFERAEKARQPTPAAFRVFESAPGTKKGISSGVNKQGRTVRNIGQEFKKQQKPQGAAVASGAGDQVLLQKVKTVTLQKQVQKQAQQVKQVQTVKPTQAQKQVQKVIVNGKVRQIKKMSPVFATAILVARPMLAQATKAALLQKARQILSPGTVQAIRPATAQATRQAQAQTQRTATRQATAQRSTTRQAPMRQIMPAVPEKLPIKTKGSKRTTTRTKKKGSRQLSSRQFRNEVASINSIFG